MKLKNLNNNIIEILNQIISLLSAKIGKVLTPLYLCQLEVIKKQRIFDDGYNDHNTYDDCILKEVARKYPESNIMDILKPGENKTHYNDMNFSVFRKLSAQFEYEIQHGVCNIPNLKLQPTYILKDLSLNAFAFSIGRTLKQPLSFKIEFSSTVTKEVKIILLEMLGIYSLLYFVHDKR